MYISIESSMYIKHVHTCIISTESSVYMQVLRTRSENEVLVQAQHPLNARISELQKELGAQQRQHDKVRGLLEERISALMRQV
jgi:hypothetical protein